MPLADVREGLQDGRVDVIALKYLELARDEILERMRYSNQLILFYVGAVSAFLGWAYTSSGTKAASGQQVAWLTANQPEGLPIPVHLLIPVALVVSFVAVAGSWILNENEYMVEALAKYQKHHLSQHLHQVTKIRLWECSNQLLEGGLTHILIGSMGVQSFLLNIPNALLVMFAWLLLRGHMYRPETFFFWLSAALTTISITTCVWMMRRRYVFSKTPTPG